ncbi:hypothetical protein [Chitinophaga sp.]|uniref:hypothetical protein n=1 Tax=Chitinophaga sp. TaxID=1869181 RepID=UPI002F95CBCE
MELTRNNILEFTNGGLKTFKALHPELNIYSLNSDFIKCPFKAFHPKSFSIHKKGKQWYFKDTTCNISGDIFDYIALITGLIDNGAEAHVLEMIAGIYNEEDDENRLIESTIFHNGLRLSLTGANYDNKYLKQKFEWIIGNKTIEVLKHFDLRPLDSLTLFGKNGRKYNILSSFETDIPQIFFAFNNSFYVSDHALIYEPLFRKVYDWGDRPHNFVLGHFECQELLKSGAADNSRLIVTDNVESLLRIHAMNIPAVACVDTEFILSDYLLQGVIPQYYKTELYLDRLDRYYYVDKKYTELERKYGLKQTAVSIKSCCGKQT